MRAQNELKRSTKLIHVGILFLTICMITHIVLFHFSVKASILFAVSYLVFGAYLFIQKYQRLYLFDDYFVARSLSGLQMVNYHDVRNIRINRQVSKHNISKGKTISVECIDEKNEVLCALHPALLRPGKNKELFFATIKENNPFHFIERNFHTANGSQKRQTFLISMASLVFIVSLLAVTWL